VFRSLLWVRLPGAGTGGRRHRRGQTGPPSRAHNPPMALLERETQLTALDEWLGDSRASRGRLVLVAGEAGAGKTALVDAFRHRHPEARWLLSACDGIFTPRPLAPVIDVAESVGGELARLAFTAGTAREQLFAALLRELLAAGDVGVLVVEDVHWADRATLDLLHFLSHRLQGARAMLLVTYRDDGADPSPDLHRTLGHLVTRGVTRRVTVPPLTPAAVAELTRASGLGAEELHRLTGGNPFFLTEALRGAGDRIPHTAREAVLARVADLDPATRGVLDDAALLGARVPRALLHEVAGVGTTEAALDTLTARALLDDNGAELSFRHEIARLAIADAVPDRRAADVHARALSALKEQDRPDDARLAHHAEGAGDAPAVLRHAPLAAATASRLGAHRQAAEQYRRALRFVGPEDLGRRATLLELSATELGIVDRWEEARAEAEEALDLWLTLGDDLRAGGTSTLLCRAYWRVARGDDSTAVIERALALLEPLGPTPELARAEAMAAARMMCASRDDEALVRCDRAARLAADLELPDVLSDVLDTEACVRAGRGQPWDAKMAGSIALARDHGLHAVAGRAHANQVSLLVRDARFRDGLEAASEGLSYSDEHDVGTYSRCIRGAHAELLELVGRWDDADRALAELLPMATSPENRIQALVTAGRLAARRGEVATARAHLEEALASALGTGDPQFVVPARLASAEVWWLAGDDVAAASQVLATADVMVPTDGAMRAEVALWGRRVGLRLDPGAGVPGPWALHLADPAAALEGWLGLGCPYLAALAGTDAGDEVSLRRALGLLDDLGAVATARLVRRRLRAGGARAVPAGLRASTRADPLGLTFRERDVLDLIVAGLGNAQIADQLVISPKTVERHVSAVLAKLGVSDRHSAAEVVRAHA
jgi:ATP/maltotriose-dependent transcriptional regulator MalT